MNRFRLRGGEIQPVMMGQSSCAEKREEKSCFPEVEDLQQFCIWSLDEFPFPFLSYLKWQRRFHFELAFPQENGGIHVICRTGLNRIYGLMNILHFPP
jgi:hypothetical protein